MSTRKYDLTHAAAVRIERRLVLDENDQPRYPIGWGDLVRAVEDENPADRTAYAISWLEWATAEENETGRASRIATRIAIERARKANQLESRTRGFARALDRLFDEAQAHPYPSSEDADAWNQDDTN